MRAGRVAAGALLATAMLAGCGDPEPTCGDFPLSPEKRTCIAESIEWMVDRYYPFEDDKPDVSLDEFRRRVRAANNPAFSDDAFLVQLQLAVAYLRDGHTRLTRPITAPSGRPAAELVRVNDAFYVATTADPLLQMGDRILEVDGEEAFTRHQRLLDRVAASNDEGRSRVATLNLLIGPAGVPAQLRIERGGAELDVAPQRGFVTFFSGGPPAPRRFGEVGYIRVSSFAFLDDVDAFDRALAELEDTEGLVIDLRGNGGGGTHHVDMMLGRFVDTTLPKYRMLDENGNTIRRFGPGSRGRRYAGPVAVLSDPLTYSAANYFVQRVQRDRIGTVVGERSGGGAASPARYRLLAPGVEFRISALLVQDETGGNAEDGLDPDLPVVLTAEEVAAGLASLPGDPATDKVLAEAIRHLESR